MLSKRRDAQAEQLGVDGGEAFSTACKTEMLTGHLVEMSLRKFFFFLFSFLENRHEVRAREGEFGSYQHIDV